MSEPLDFLKDHWKVEHRSESGVDYGCTNKLAIEVYPILINSDRGFALGSVAAIIPNDRLCGDHEVVATLMAAAPEMYWALTDVRSFLKRSGYDTTLVDSALNKAVGK